MEWLGHNPTTQTPNLCQTMEVNHIAIDPVFSPFFTKLFTSELSDSICIASLLEKPSLSVMYPGTDKPPLILSRDDQFSSALFVTISDQEYLAAVSEGQIKLWNSAQNTSSVAYELTDVSSWLLCAIDERTFACVEGKPTSDDFSKIYTLNTDTEKFTLSGTLPLKASGKITDLCCVKTNDGTPCLLLSFQSDNLVQCVEIVGMKVRWEVDEQQMGEIFNPCSIFTDGGTVFVVTAGEAKLLLLSAEDGLVLRYVYLHPSGIIYPTSVRLLNEYLYVGHLNEKLDTYCISKFTKPLVV